MPPGDAVKTKRAKFLPEEDARLRRLVAERGTASWDAIAAELPGRNPRQCRERWKHYLSGERVKAPWAPEEDQLLYDQMRAIGPKWTTLATFFPGRTDIEVKSHWMQNFAHFSTLHVRSRIRRCIALARTDIAPATGRWQLMPRIPNVAQTANAHICDIATIRTGIVIPTSQLGQQQPFVVLPHFNESGMK
jgi:hypothetical protein